MLLVSAGQAVESALRTRLVELEGELEDERQRRRMAEEREEGALRQVGEEFQARRPLQPQHVPPRRVHGRAVWLRDGAGHPGEKGAAVRQGQQHLEQRAITQQRMAQVHAIEISLKLREGCSLVPGLVCLCHGTTCLLRSKPKGW
mmetsp:Transcript_21703/g.51651  ORF Transcript_21703/g.51651 Transcript_21703/m.51651 type:complete len:145 (-) Transcript_21703:833-1267(-)